MEHFAWVRPPSPPPPRSSRGEKHESTEELPVKNFSISLPMCSSLIEETHHRCIKNSYIGRCIIFSKPKAVQFGLFRVSEPRDNGYYPAYKQENDSTVFLCPICPGVVKPRVSGSTLGAPLGACGTLWVKSRLIPPHWV